VVWAAERGDDLESCCSERACGDEGQDLESGKASAGELIECGVGCCEHGDVWCLEAFVGGMASDRRLRYSRRPPRTTSSVSSAIVSVRTR